MQERQKRTEITQDRVLKELAAIAFAKATDYAEVEDGQVIIKDTANLDEHGEAGQGHQPPRSGPCRKNIWPVR